MRDLAGGHVADLTVIETLDEARPSYQRCLLQDASTHELTVLRVVKDPDGAVHVSIARASGEALLAYSVDSHHVGVVDFCGAHLTWSDVGRVANFPAAFKAAVESALAACPSETSSTLQRLATLGAHHLPTLPTSFLEDLMYPSIWHVPLGKRKVVSKTYPFDPATTPPDAFERLFGGAYYQ